MEDSLTATNGAVIAVSGTIADAVVIAPDVDASVVLGGNLGSSLTITGDASSVTLEGTTVAGVVNVSIGDAGTFESSASYTLAVGISGGSSITLSGATAASDVTITGVSNQGSISIANEISGDLSIGDSVADDESSKQVTYTGSSIGGVVTVNMNSSLGSFVASSLTTFGDAVTINAPSLSLGALTTISGLATFEKVESLLLPSLTSATSGIVAEMATIFRAVVFDTNGDIDLAAGASVTVKAINSMTHLVGSDTGSILISEQDVDINTNGFLQLTSFISTSASDSVDYIIHDNNESLATLTISGDSGILTVGTDGTDGLEELDSFETNGTLKGLKVFNTAVTSMDLNHTENSTDGAFFEISNNDSLVTFSSVANKVYSFIVTDNASLTSFEMPNLRDGFYSIPADVDNAVEDNDIDFVFTVNDNALEGTHQTNDATNEEAFFQVSLAKLEAYIVAIAEAVADDDGSTLVVSMNYIDTDTNATVVGDTDSSVGVGGQVVVRNGENQIAYYQTATGAGINSLDEVVALQ
jgi:hypothetical protein